MKLKSSEKIEELDVRCRTIGDITCTGLTLSTANTLEDIILKLRLHGQPKEEAGMMTNVRNLLWRTGRRKDIFNRMQDRLYKHPIQMTEFQERQDGYLNMQLLRFTTAGSVDDGKSTLSEAYCTTARQYLKTSWKLLKGQPEQGGGTDKPVLAYRWLAC